MKMTRLSTSLLVLATVCLAAHATKTNLKLRGQAKAPSVGSIISTLNDVLRFMQTEEGTAKKSNNERDKWCKDTLRDLKSALSKETNAVTDLEAELSEVQSNKAELETKVTESEQKVSQCHDELKGLSEKLTKLRGDNHGEMEKLNAEIARLDDAIVAEKNAGNSKDKVARLKSDREKLRADLEKSRESFQTEAANLKDLQAEQDKRLIDLNDELAQSRPALTLAQETISGNELKLKNAKKAMDSLDKLQGTTKTECKKHETDSGKLEQLRGDQITSVKSAVALVKPLGASFIQESSELDTETVSFLQMGSKSRLSFLPTSAVNNPLDTEAAMVARSKMSSLLGLSSSDAANTGMDFEGTSADALARGEAAVAAANALGGSPPPQQPQGEQQQPQQQLPAVVTTPAQEQQAQQQQQQQQQSPSAQAIVNFAGPATTAEQLEARALTADLQTGEAQSDEEMADPFAGVKKMIVEMLAKLKEEANGDLSKAQSCEMNFRKNKLAVFRSKNKLLAAQAGVRNYKAAIDEAKNDQQVALEEATKLEQENARISTLLDEQLAEATRMKAANSQAVTVLKEVVNVVQQLFPSLVQLDAAPQAGSGALAQIGASVETHKARAASDVVEAVRAAIKGLEDQNAELDRSQSELQTMIAGDGGLKKAYGLAIKAAKKQTKTAESAQVTAEDGLVNSEQDVKKAQGSIKQLATEKNMLDEDCGPGQSEEDVAEAREQEIKALKNALEVLAGDAMPR